MTFRLLWDASALAKRYVPETGTDCVAALLANNDASNTNTFHGYAETFSSLLRKHNRGDIDLMTFAAARELLRREVIENIEFTLIAVEVQDVPSGLDLMARCNINSSDSSILATFIRYARTLNEACVLVASDKRLLRAATAEGLAALNPETLPAADIPTFLAAL